MKATDLNTALFAFGRLNPTLGHAKLVDMVKRYASPWFTPSKS